MHATGRDGQRDDRRPGPAQYGPRRAARGRRWRGVPDDRRAVVAGRQQRPVVGGEGYGGDHAAHLEAQCLAPSGDIPDPDAAVVATGGQPPAGAEGQAVDRVVVPAQQSRRAGPRDVAQVDGARAGSHCQGPAVGPEGEGQTAAIEPVQFLRRPLAEAAAPYAEVLARGGVGAAVRRHRHVPKPADQRQNLRSSRGQVPQDEPAVIATGEQPPGRPVGGQIADSRCRPRRRAGHPGSVGAVPPPQGPVAAGRDDAPVGPG